MAGGTGGGPRFAVAAVERWVCDLLVRLGIPAGKAATAATALVLADRRGVESHGVARLPFYADRLLAGQIDPSAETTVLRETASTLALDGRNGFGLCVALDAMEQTLAKATVAGSCLTTVRQSNHFGIGAIYALMAARAGLGGLAMTNAGPLVVPTFGSQAMLGTNPLSFAVPTGPGDAPPLVLDMATSAVAWGKIEVARRANAAIPLGWALDAASAPTTDPWAAHWLTPLGGDRLQGGHKGYGLSVLVDTFCGPLAGAAWGAHVASSRARDRPSDIGHTFLAWRIDAFREPADFYRDVNRMLNELRASPPAAGNEATGVLAPGDPELAAERETAERGIPLNPAVLAELDALADRLGIGDLGAAG